MVHTRCHTLLFCVIKFSVFVTEKAIWKVRYATTNTLPGADFCYGICGCYGADRTVHDQPLLFNVATDPSESQPLDTTVPEHRNVLKIVSEAVAEQVQSVEQVENQFDYLKMMPRPWLQPCCNFPYCNCIDPVYVNGTE